MPDEPTIGELNRNITELRKQVETLTSKLESRVVGLDYYLLAHKTLEDRVSDTEKRLDKFSTGFLFYLVYPLIVAVISLLVVGGKIG